MISSPLMFQIDPEQFNKVLSYIRSGKESGAKLETGGDKIGSRGYYIQPTVFSNVKVFYHNQFFFLFDCDQCDITM